MFKISETNKEPVIRISWPFKNMEIGQKIEIDDRQWWSKAVTTAHITGRQKNMKFITRWIKEESKGIIWRIE